MTTPKRTQRTVSAAKFFKESARAKAGELAGVMSQFMPMAIPPWIRLPKPKERNPLVPLSRTTLCEICIPTKANNFNPPVRGAKCIKSIASKKGGGKPARAKKRGIWLIPTAPLFAYLAESCMISPNESARAENSNKNTGAPPNSKSARIPSCSSEH